MCVTPRRRTKDRPAPEQVFTPSRPVGPEMWANRESAGPDGGVQRRFQRQLAEPGRQIVLYGDTGVGKTSLVEHVVISAEEIGLVRVECGPPLATMLQEALR